jgi:formate hydrogenlyase subunit 3/multisubunit Na+/H+ antiporter MnhD subunit
MNTPFLWIVFPGLAAGLLYLLRRQEKIVYAAGVCVAFLLAGLAWILPIGDLVVLGPWSFRVTDTLLILGRRLILTNAERPVLLWIYLAAAFWFGGTRASRAGDLFIPFGLAVVVFLTASLAVDPVLYAALFIEMAALLCIPLLTSPHKPVVRVLLRFLSFQTLGSPFILFSGWLADRGETDPGQAFPALQIVLLAALGFSFLLAVFPFHTWIPMLAQESHPYTAAFVFYLLPGAISLFAIKYLQSQEGLVSVPDPAGLLRIAGGSMVAIGGIWAAFQRHAGRMLAYAVMVEIGYTFLAIGILPGVTPVTLESSSSLISLIPLFITRGLALGTWAFALSIFYAHTPGLSFIEIGGAGRRFPFATAALILAHFALAGFPILAGFPVRLSIISSLAHVDPIAVAWVLLGMGGLLVGGLRTLAALVMGIDAKPWVACEDRSQRFFLVAGMAALILAGIFPIT